jgi:hypothetical protein
LIKSSGTSHSLGQPNAKPPRRLEFELEQQLDRLAQSVAALA